MKFFVFFLIKEQSEPKQKYRERKRAPVLCLELKNLARRKSEKEHEDEGR